MPEISASKFLTTAGWCDVPHLTEATKAELRSGMEPHLADAREKGIPSMGSGAVWPMSLEDVLIDPFPLPKHFNYAYALDVGWNRTAALWSATDPEAGVTYIYTEHYRGKAEPSIHAAAIKARGEWIPGVIDPAAQGRNQKDGTQLIADYQELGLNLVPAINAVESGVYKVWQGLSDGTIKFFRTGTGNLQNEFTYYRRDKDGKIVKADDHLCDCLRYLIVSGPLVAVSYPVARGGQDYIGDDRIGY